MIRWIRLAGLAAAAFLGAPGGLAALAADPRLPPEAGGPMPHGQAGGMPQLDFGNPLMIAQIVWLLLIFGLLYFVMANYALPRVGEILEERRRRIGADLDAARAAKAEADAAAAGHREATLRARAEAQAAIANAVQQAQEEAQARADALNARLAEQIGAAEARIAAARDAAMGALRQVAGDTAEALVRRLTGDADRAAVDAAVARELAARGRA
jgi:F-type H+-transporting ATPase subunit b